MAKGRKPSSRRAQVARRLGIASGDPTAESWSLPREPWTTGVYVAEGRWFYALLPSAPTKIHSPWGVAELRETLITLRQKYPERSVAVVLTRAAAGSRTYLGDYPVVISLEEYGKYLEYLSKERST